MKISRNLTFFIRFIFDQLIPPCLRDSRWFMWLPFKLLFGKKADVFFNFKEIAPILSEKEFCRIYKETASVHIQRETDLNQECLEVIDNSILGNTVLDIACGRGYLAKRLAEKYRVTGADIIIDSALQAENPNIKFKEAQLANLPFKDDEFDTVICTHTLEHVQNIQKAIFELRRVARQRLIIVVPKQRPYRYTFDLHLHFFPYAGSLLMVMGATGKNVIAKCIQLKGDWFYLEDKF
ncbi:MAG: class I SAM-dependent methyltransferase [Desulfobacterium sp.]|nr:class I SAM-dependent methyltransferase [Desulfobacterium sp.]